MMIYYVRDFVCKNMCKVSRQYKKGIETEQKIVSEAKKQFLKKGYKKVSVTSICDNIGIMSGNASYYFPHKWNIGLRMFQDFMYEVMDFVEAEYGPESTFFKYSLALFICSDRELADAERCRFVREVFEKGFFIDFGTSFCEEFTPEYNKGTTKQFTEEQMRKTMVATVSVYTMLVLDLLKQTDDNPSRDEVINISWIICNIIGRIFGKDVEAVHDEVNKATDIYKSIDMSQFRFI